MSAVLGYTSASAGNPLALTGAVAATRYVGGTASVAPTAGTFAVGDFVVSQDAKVWVCTVAGTPGTWTQVGAGSSPTISRVDYNYAFSPTSVTCNGDIGIVSLTGFNSGYASVRTPATFRILNSSATATDLVLVNVIWTPETNEYPLWASVKEVINGELSIIVQSANDAVDMIRWTHAGAKPKICFQLIH